MSDLAPHERGAWWLRAELARTHVAVAKRPTEAEVEDEPPTDVKRHAGARAAFERAVARYPRGKDE